MVGDMAQALGQAPKEAKESDSYMPYVTSIASPLIAGALGGLGAKNTKQFLNNLVNPLAGTKLPSLGKIAKKVNKPIDITDGIQKALSEYNAQLDARAQRAGYNVNRSRNAESLVDEPIFNQEVVEPVVNTNPNRTSMRDVVSDQLMQNDRLFDRARRWADANNLDQNLLNESNEFNSQIENILRSHGVDMNDVQGYLDNLSPGAYANIENSLIEHLDNLDDATLNNYLYPSVSQADAVKNKSGFTKDRLLKLSQYDEDFKKAVEGLSDEEFASTVFDPKGKLVPYSKTLDLDKIIYDPSVPGKMRLKDASPISKEDYAQIFNENLDQLNELIDKYNTSGVKYKVEGLEPEGEVLKFSNPKQTIKQVISQKDAELIKNSQKMLDQINSDFAKGLVTDEQSITNHLKNKANLERKIKNLTRKYDDIQLPQGTSSFFVELMPGRFRGEVEDIANTEYLKYFPGINMSATSSSVFSDALPRRGTGTYKAINEYLKKLDLGRVKSGFNSQTDSSEGLWRNSIEKGDSYGFYSKPNLIHSVMKKKGGVVVKLTKAEIEKYVKDGYIVEEH
jgi:hypothetical protein